jgi:endonuclease/exonuclease/phosphatase family metal-dependent hydrolase
MELQRDARIATSRELQRALGRFRTWNEFETAPEAGELAARLRRHLDVVLHAAPGAFPAPPASARVHVVHWNILHGKRLAEVQAALREQPALAGADLVSLNEVDSGLARSGNLEVAFELARELGLHAAWTPLFLELEGGYRTPTAVAALPQGESLFGLALLSRWPLESVQRIELQTPSALLFERERKTGNFVALIATVQHPVRPFQAVVTHLDVHGGPATRLAQIRRILAALPPGPALLCGDLNTTTFARGGGTRALRTLATMAFLPQRQLRQRLLAPHLPAGRAREPLFEALRGAGFAIEPFNDLRETLDLHFDDLHELDFLPAPLRHAAVAVLRGVERRTVLRLDWIVARGFVPDPDSAPRAVTALLHAAPAASDHAPITCTVRNSPS